MQRPSPPTARWVHRAPWLARFAACWPGAGMRCFRVHVQRMRLAASGGLQGSALVLRCPGSDSQCSATHCAHSRRPCLQVLRHILCNMWRWVLPEIKMLERYGVHGDFNDVDITTQQTILQLTG